MSMKERLAMWKKRKEQEKTSADPVSASASGGEDSSASSVQFVTAPGSAVTRSNASSEAGFESLPGSPGPSAISKPEPNSKPSSTLKSTAPGGGLLKIRPLSRQLGAGLGKSKLGGLRLQKPSSLGTSVFGADFDADGTSDNDGSSDRRQPLPVLSFEGDSLTTSVKEQLDAASKSAMEVDEPEIDPLEEYMQNVASEPLHKQPGSKSADGASATANLNGAQAYAEDDGNYSDGIPEDSDDVIALAAKRMKKKELAPVDHSKMNYESFKKDFYIEPADLRNLTPEEVDLMRADLGDIKIRGVDPPKPAANWSYFGLPAVCADIIRHQGFEKPTSIQAQAVPAILSGRDVIGVAKTGSGKTLAFILPMLRHIKAQRSLEQGEGPVGLVMTPTRELAVQIFRECKPFLKPLGLRAVCAYGGSGIKDQIGELKRGAEIVVCTPGRMIDLLCANSGRVTNLHRVTYMVLDEADRMFDMGFEPQVTKIVQCVRPSRQTVLFSATFPRQMEALARKILRRPLEIVVGGRALIPPEVTQHVEVVEADSKFVRLLGILGQAFNDNPETLALIFVDRQESADGLLRDLMHRGYVCNSLHGGKDQTDRDQAIVDFKNRIYSVLIATSVAARGLDVRGLNVVINYDCPNHMEDLIHRVGRTGRAGNKGDAYTFIMPDQGRYASEVVKAMKLSGLTPPADVQALTDAFIEKVKQGTEYRGGKSGFGGKGLEKLDKDRDMVKKIQKVTYGAASGEALDDDDDEDANAGQSDTESDAETSAPASASHRPKAKPRNAETVRRLPATPRSASGTVASPAAQIKKPQPQDLSSPKELSAAAQAALLAAQAAARRLNITSDQGSTDGRQGSGPISIVDQINQQLGTPAAAAGSATTAATSAATPVATSADIAAAVAASIAPKTRPGNSATKDVLATSKDGAAAPTPASAAAAAAASGSSSGNANSTTTSSTAANATIPVGLYGCELDINDYPQKARWRATNRETLTQIIEQTGAAITTRGVFVPPGKPVPEGERKLYLSIESETERSAEQAKNEIKRILTEATLQIMEQEARAGGTSGRYSVV
ncbi:pre-mRNA processing RNA-helicase [Coemansia erecta]|uniref:RNA helicase n=1 Tax=Coemansia erecta TaxID=147472 RepID=A0A9W7XXU3_9FUNG|nr:pre-mRNA processing RNA-helicase [Coemansia erecta]